MFNNPRSTIGTLTNIDGFLKILYSVAGKPVCPICYKETNSDLFCEDCGCFAEKLTAKDFSPISKEGMCLTCNGVGSIFEFTEDKLIPDKNITLKEIWTTAKKNTFNIPSNKNVFEKLMKFYGYKWTDRYSDVSPDFQNKILYGSDEKFTIHLNKVANKTNHLGILTYMDNQYKKTISINRRKDLEYYLDNSTCPECNGGKLKQTSLHVSVSGKSFAEVQHMSFLQLKEFLDMLELDEDVNNSLKDIVADIKTKVENICSMSVHYLSLDRQVSTLSGGELQRLLISQHVSSDLTGIMYILDEPTIGLHDHDTIKIIKMLKKLRDMGNTVIVIEHDEEVIQSADYIIEVGPDAGKYGGEIIACGKLQDILKNNKSLTGYYLKNRTRIRKENNKFHEFIEVSHLNNHNLKNISIKFPLESLTCITGVSGCGKSTMIKEIYDIFRDSLRNNYIIGDHIKESIATKIEDIIYIDQNPIKGSSRSNLMTYIGFYDEIRSLFFKAAQKEGVGYSKSDFSINVPGGRCECCHGQGEIEVDMYFMKNEYIVCEECGGKRFNPDILEVKYKGLSISDVFSLSVEEAQKIFNDKKLKVTSKALKYLEEFGLGYLKLGQTTDSISGGEAQRIHLITNLVNRKNKKTLFIFDEPSTGLHFADIEYLIKLFDELIHEGQTVLVIEHNMDIIYNSDFIIDLGPASGDAGGEIMFDGSITDFLDSESGVTADCLKNYTKSHYKGGILDAVGIN